MIGVDLSNIEFIKTIAILSEYLTRLYIKLERPPADITSNQFWIMIDELVNSWSVCYKQEAKDFIYDIKLERAIESGCGNKKCILYRKSIAYPPTLYQMIKVFFPDLKLQNRKFIQKFISRYPIFNASNYAPD
jgi:hypothetical protein